MQLCLILKEYLFLSWSILFPLEKAGITNITEGSRGFGRQIRPTFLREDEDHQNITYHCCHQASSRQSSQIPLRPVGGQFSCPVAAPVACPHLGRVSPAHAHDEVRGVSGRQGQLQRHHQHQESSQHHPLRETVCGGRDVHVF